MKALKIILLVIGSIGIGWNGHSLCGGRLEKKWMTDAYLALEEAHRYIIHAESARATCATQNTLLREEIQRISAEDECSHHLCDENGNRVQGFEIKP